MLTLTLFRHAKSSWDDGDLDDFDRPLAKRGKMTAPKMGAALAKLNPKIDLVLCSTAKRARDTLSLVLPELTPVTPKVHYVDALYHGLPEVLFEQIIEHGGSASHIVLVGHNPGLEMLAARLIGSGTARDIEAMTRKFPTAAMAHLTFDASRWSDVMLAGGHIELVLTPRLLT